MAINIYRNPFVVATWAPAYTLIGTVCANNDPLLFTLYIFATLGMLGAYVTEFPILSGLYPNELLHKMAVSSLLGILFGLVLWAVKMAFTDSEGTDTGMIAVGSKFLLTWAVMGIPAYLMMVFLVSRLNKRDLEAEDKIRKEKKKKRKGGGPPIMDRDGF